MRWLPSCSPSPRVLQRRGDEPATARSPLRMRLILSLIAAPLAIAVAVLAALGLRAGERPREPLIIFAVAGVAIALVALIDIAVLRCRLRVARGRSHGAHTRPALPAQRPAGPVAGTEGTTSTSVDERDRRGAG